MKKIDLGQAITILANVGVIAGILFLAIELQQNNELLEAQARAERESVRRTVFTRWLENPELVTVRAKALSGEPLTVEEAFQMRTLNNWTLWDWRFIHGEYLNDLLDEAALPVDGWRRVYRTEPGLPALWEESKSESPTEFRDWMEERIVPD